MARGGKRAGAGRKPGSATKRTREVADKASAEGVTPLEYLLAVMRDGKQPDPARLEAAKSAAPYVHPRLSAIEHTGQGGGAIQTVNRIELVDLTKEGRA